MEIIKLINPVNETPTLKTIFPYKIKEHIIVLNNEYSIHRYKKYNLNIFLVRAKEIYGDKYDYSQIKEQDINGVNSLIIIRCKNCNYQWTSTINNHINIKRECIYCG